MTDHPAKPILIVEDDVALNRMLCDQVKRLGFAVLGARSLSEADAMLQTVEPALILLDVRLPDSEGLSAVNRFREQSPVIILTAYGSIEQAIEAVQAGAADYLIKPVSVARLELAVKRAIDAASMRRKLQHLEKQTRTETRAGMVGRSPGFLKVMDMVNLVAEADTTVLVLGESGVGKELVAGSIHELSARHANPLITIDCATLHENLLESELFGHERGAFTGADRKKEGLVEVAEGGTVFLDEIGEISPIIQAKLLRLLETSKFRRLGGTRDLSANVRFITATNRDLAGWSKQGKFREDLYYRLSPFTILVPPLRERQDDIIALARHFLASRNFMRNSPKTFHPSTEQALTAYKWPGNIRELRNVVERGLLMSANSTAIMPKHLSLPSAGQSVEGFSLLFDHEPTLDEVKAAYMQQVLALHGGNRAEASRAMGISERTLYRTLLPSNEPDKA